MKCENPVQLKNGLVVPCGRCMLCKSARRDDWSVRLQLHTLAFDRMPYFITLTYDNEHLNYASFNPTLCKSDLQLFIKRVKDRFNLYNTTFSYFGCGEYGDKLHRPHCHILLFGFDELDEVYNRSWLGAHDLIADIWKNGHVDIGVAEWSGIHYVTKYVLKLDDEEDDPDIQKPFIVFSQGLGTPWLNTTEGKLMKSRVNIVKVRNVLATLPELDTSSLTSLRDTAQDCITYLRDNGVHDLYVMLPSGKKAQLPRYIRRKLFGSFEVLNDNPWMYINHLRQLIASCDYILQHGQYDMENETTYGSQVIEFAKRKIQQRLILNRAKK